MPTDSLTAILNSYNVFALQAISERLGVSAATKPEMVKKLVRTIGTPAAVGAALAALSPLQRAVLDRLVLAGRPLATDAAWQLVRDLVDPLPQHERRTAYDVGRLPQPGDANKADSRELADVVATLTSWGLVFTQALSATSNVAELGLRDILLIPDKVRKTLVEFYPDTPPPYDPAGKTIQAAGPRQLYRDMFRLWTAIRRRPVVVTNSGYLRKNDVRVVGQALGLLEEQEDFDDEGNLPYLIFLRETMVAIGALQQNGTRLEAAPIEQLRAYFAQPWPARTVALLHEWLNGGGWTGLEGLYLPGFGYTKIASDTFNAAYTSLLERLLRLPDSWVDLRDFNNVMRLRQPDFLLADPSRSYGAFAYNYTGADWDSREGALISLAIGGELGALGVLDVARNAENAVAGFHVNPAGRPLLAALLSGQAAPPADALPASDGNSHVVIQPNFQVLAVGDISDLDLLRLSEVAELVRVDQAVELKLTRASVQAAQQAGWSAGQIIDFLSDISRAPLAQNVARSLLDWAAALDRILIRRNAGILLAIDPALLDKAQENEKAQPWLASRPLPGVAILQTPPGSADQPPAIADLRRAISATGELAALTDVGATGPAPSFRFDEFGLVTFQAPLPDLRLLGLLALIAAPGADGLRLSRERVSAAAATRRWKIEDVNTLLRELAAWHIGPVPAQVAAQVKAWSGFYGRAELRTVTVLVVERPELLAELSADPELAALLQPLSNMGAAALVAPSSPAGRAPRGKAKADQQADSAALERLRQLLSERGFLLQ